MRVILVDVFVAGQPKTKGSMVVRPNKTLANSPASSHWRALMAGAVRDDYARRWGPSFGPYDGPVAVSCWAHLPVDPLAYGAGDLDKLLRNVLDALGTTSKNPRYNGGVIVDDNQVTQFREVGKSGPAERVGVHIVVARLL